MMKNSYNVAKKYGSKIAIGTGVALLPITSFAAVDVAVTTAISDAATDVGTVGGAVFIVLVTAFAFRALRRAL